MADTKTSALTAIAGSALATNDLFPVVDVSAAQTKSVTRAEMFLVTPPIDILGALTADGINLDSTITAAGTTGAQTINKPAGAVNFAAAAASLVVTNSLVTVNSIILATVATNDTTMKSVSAVPAAGSFTLRGNANPTAETRVNFVVIN